MFKLECSLNVIITLHSVGGIVCQFYSEVRMSVDINVFYESWLTVLKYGTKSSCRDCSGSLVNSKLVLVKGFIMGASMTEKKLILKHYRSNMAAQGNYRDCTGSLANNY